METKEPLDFISQEQEANWAHQHPIWQEAKDYVNFARMDILKQIHSNLIKPQSRVS